MDIGLSGTHVVVSGANGGIGSETVAAFLKQGAIVTAQYRSSSAQLEKILDASPDYKTKMKLVKAELNDEAQHDILFQQATKEFGPVMVCVVNHGIWEDEYTLLRDMSLSQFSETLSTNLTSSFLLIRAFLRQLPRFDRSKPEDIAASKKVSIVLVGSTSGRDGEAGHVDYACSKSAMQYGLTLSLKNELPLIAPLGRANAVAPGWVASPMSLKAMNSEGVIEKALATTPLKKIAQPIDVVNQILVLSSPVLSGHVTGMTVMVEGGMAGEVLNSPESLKGIVL